MIEVKPQPVGGPPVVRLALLVVLCLFIVAGAAVAFGAAPAPAADPSRVGSAAAASPDASAAPTPGSTTTPGQPGSGMPGMGGRGGFRGPGMMGGFANGGPGGMMGGFANGGWVCDQGASCRGGFAGPLTITITAIDGSNLSLKTADGWTRTVDASGATITRSGQTIAVSDLKVGDTVQIDEQRNSDGTYKVTAIQVILPEIEGTVQAVTGETFTVQQRDGTTQAVSVTADTTYSLGSKSADKSALVKGVEVVVEGTKSGDVFTATAVRISPSTVTGTVTKKSATTITVTQRDGSTATINVDSSTTYHVSGVTSPSLSDVAVNDTVVAQGTLADGSLNATDVWAGTASFHEGGPGQRMPFGGPGWFGGGSPKGPNASPAPSPGTNG